MPGQPGLPNLTAMRGRRKGGAPTPQPRILQGIAAHADAFLANLAARAYSQPSIEAHRWALRQFSAWTAGRGSDDPALFIRADLKKRLSVHNQGGNISTKTGCPWKLVWYGGFESKTAASDFERYLKTASGKAFARKRLLSS